MLAVFSTRRGHRARAAIPTGPSFDLAWAVPASAAWLVVTHLGLALVLFLGCAPSLGPCDPMAAREVVYDDQAQPSYAGQALLHGSCGYGSFCHSAEAAGYQRFYVPVGLDFDVAPASYDDGEGDVARLQQSHGASVARQYEVWQQVLSGGMPPARRGRALLDSPLRPRYWRSVSEHHAAPLPEIESEEGQEVLRNWLACGLPVVERSQPRLDGEPSAVGDEVPLASCVAASDCPFPGRPRCDPAVGQCARCVDSMDCNAHSARSLCDEGRCVEPVEPTWESIYDVVVADGCAVEGCHGGARGPSEGVIDLRDRDDAYDRLAATSTTEACGETGLAGIAPGDPDASLFYRKLRVDASGEVICGAPMPSSGDALPSSWLDAIATWITSGAPRVSEP